mmetsp:Transcript_290/g.685  ORF Transcript_290/g.685 Transcript_290/m.685 type:complete len:244 (-) Transcript_290:1549-2280(-)
MDACVGLVQIGDENVAHLDHEGVEKEVGVGLGLVGPILVRVMGENKVEGSDDFIHALNVANPLVQLGPHEQNPLQRRIPLLPKVLVGLQEEPEVWVRPYHVLPDLVEQHDVLLLVRIRGGGGHQTLSVTALLPLVVAALATQLHPLLLRGGVADGDRAGKFGAGGVGGAPLLFSSSSSSDLDRRLAPLFIIVFREEERVLHPFGQLIHDVPVQCRRGLLNAPAVLQRVVVRPPLLRPVAAVML